MISEGYYRASKDCRLTLCNLRALDWSARFETGDNDDLRKELESTLRRVEKEDGLSHSCISVRLDTGDDDDDDDNLRKELESSLRKLEKEDRLSSSCISLRTVISADLSCSNSSRQKESLMLVLASLLRTARRSLYHCSSSSRIIRTASSDVTTRPVTLDGDRGLHACW
jgi:hypothetical protein